MFYKITNKECELYKNLHSFRSKEIQINKENLEKIEEKIPYTWTQYRGNGSQFSFARTSYFYGFVFTCDESEICLKTWRKESDGVYVPNRRTKLGRSMFEFLNRDLKRSSVFKLLDLIGNSDTSGSFKLPYLEICGDIILLKLDPSFRIKDDMIEITSIEFESLIKQTPD